MAPTFIFASIPWALIFIFVLHDQCRVIRVDAALRTSSRRLAQDAGKQNEVGIDRQMKTADTSALFSPSVLEPESYPVVLSALVYRSDVSNIASRFDLIDATKVESSQPSEMLQVSILVVDESEHDRVLAVLVQLYFGKHNSLLLSVEINETKTNELQETVESTKSAENAHHQNLFSRSKEVRANTNSKYTTISGFSCFRNLQGMTDAMFDLAKKFSNLVSVTEIGKSYENRSIYAMKITASSSQRKSNEKGKVLITAGVHPREYAPPELVMRYATTLVDNYDLDAEITWILEHTEIHIVLYVNPDGRVVAETNPSSYWRKNVNPGSNKDGCSKSSYGVDVNRNFGFMWSRDGASSDPCDNTYYGTSAESETETQALVEYAKNLFPSEQRKKDPVADMNKPYGEDITGVYIDVHASGGYTYYPWGHKDKYCPDDESLQALGRKISSFNGYSLWAPGQPDFLYPASGDTSDFMYAVMGVASFGLEIGKDFYESCNLFEEEIVSSNLPALLYAAKVANQPFSMGKGPDILDLSVNSAGLSDGEIRVAAVASDNRLVNIKGYPEFSTGDQSINEVEIYLDVHPDDFVGSNNSWSMKPVDKKFDSGEEDVEVVISTSGLPPGRHVLFAQAKDSNGYLGPVSSTFFVVEENQQNDGGTESNQPTSRPTSNTQKPTQYPTQKAPAGSSGADKLILLREEFTTGFGSFISGGSDTKYYPSAKDRLGVARIQDGSGEEAYIYSKKIPLPSSYSTMKVTFSFYGLSMESDDSFCLDYSIDESSNWVDVQCWNGEEDFKNKVWYDDTIVEFSANNADSIRVRFRCEGDNNKDDVLFDYVQVEGLE